MYGTSASAHPIDHLEGDTVIVALETLAAGWRHRWIPFGIDNQAFERAGERGASRAPRLNLLLKRIFVLQISHQFLWRPFWLSTHENLLADHLSRGRIDDFHAEAQRYIAAGLFFLFFVRLIASEAGGRTRRLTSGSEAWGASDSRALLSHAASASIAGRARYRS